MTASQFGDAVKTLDRLEVHEESISHDDDDDVTKREFESSFKASAKIAQTVDGKYGRIRDTDWISAGTQGNGATALAVLEELLCDAWGEVESDENSLIVGESNSPDIHPTVASYATAAADDQ